MSSSSNGNCAILWGILAVVCVWGSMNSLTRSLDHLDVQSPQEVAYEAVSADESKISVNITADITKVGMLIVLHFTAMKKSM